MARKPMDVQSVLVDASRYSLEEAKAKVKKMGHKVTKVDKPKKGEEQRFYRFRQREPGQFEKFRNEVLERKKKDGTTEKTGVVLVLAKSTVHLLVKAAGARGGKYLKRVPKPGGGFRYVYHSEKHRVAHQAEKMLVRAKALKARAKSLEANDMLAQAGKARDKADMLIKLARQSLKGTGFEGKAGAKVKKSFYLVKAAGAGRTHRYIRREALAGGGFRYFYRHEAGTGKPVAPPTLKSKPARAAYKELIGTARTTSKEITRVMRRKPADRGTAQSLTMLWQMKVMDEVKKAKSKGAPVEELRSLFDYMDSITTKMEAASKRKRGKGSTFEAPKSEAQRQATQKSMEANPMNDGLSLSEREGERIADAVHESEEAKVAALVKASQTPRPAGKASKQRARPAKAAVAKSAEALAVEAAAPHCPAALVKAVLEVPTYGQKTKKKTIPDDRVIAIFKAFIRTKYRNAIRWKESTSAQGLYDSILSSSEHSPIVDAALGVLEKRKIPFSVDFVKKCIKEITDSESEGEGIAPTNSDAASVAASGG